MYAIFQHSIQSLLDSTLQHSTMGPLDSTTTMALIGSTLFYYTLPCLLMASTGHSLSPT